MIKSMLLGFIFFASGFLASFWLGPQADSRLKGQVCVPDVLVYEEQGVSDYAANQETGMEDTTGYAPPFDDAGEESDSSVQPI